MEGTHPNTDHKIENRYYFVIGLSAQPLKEWPKNISKINIRPKEIKSEEDREE